MTTKIPWNILAGAFAIAVFYTTAGIIAAYIVLNGIAGATGDKITIFHEWWQTLLFLADIIFVIGLAGSVVMAVLKAKGKLKITRKEVS